MPIYQYLCDDCGFEFERAQSFHDEPLETCPECGGTVRRVISPVGIIFKGSGWYITDSRRQISGGGGQKSGNGADKATESDTKTEKTSSESSAAPAEGSTKKTTKPDTPAKETSPAS